MGISKNRAFFSKGGVSKNRAKLFLLRCIKKKKTLSYERIKEKYILDHLFRFTDNFFVSFFDCSSSVTLADKLNVLKINIDYCERPVDYLYQPLYAFQSQECLQTGQEFVKFLDELGHGFDIWADWFQGRIDGVPTDKQFLEAVANLPDEILAQEPAQINAYLKNLCQTERPLNRVRVIFLGYGEAGKTSLIRALNGLDVVAGKEQMTPGIDISTWQVPGTEIIAHFWDFGGQVVAHATHQFFLRSRCLYRPLA